MVENLKQDSTPFCHKHLQVSKTGCILPSTLITVQFSKYRANRLESTIADFKLSSFSSRFSCLLIEEQIRLLLDEHHAYTLADHEGMLLEGEECGKCEAPKLATGRVHYCPQLAGSSPVSA